MNETPSSGRAWTRIRLGVIAAGAAFALVAGVNATVNPYGAWPIEVVDSVFRRTDGVQRITVPYQLTIARPETVLVGSSRVMYGMPIEQGERDGFLNAALPAATLDEIAAVVDGARRPTLRRLVWGVDYFAFGAEAAGMRDPKIPDRLRRDARRLARETLLSMDALRASANVLGRALRGRTRLPPTRLAPLPWPSELIAQTFADDWNSGLPSLDTATREVFSEWIPAYARQHVSPERWEVFRETLARVEQDGVDLILFIAPMSAYELELIVQSGHWASFLEWKRRLAAVRPFWDFSGYDPATTAEPLYLDPVHFKPCVGHLILRHLLDRDCRACGDAARAFLAAAAPVDAQSVAAHLDRADADQARYRQADGPVAQAIARLLSESPVQAVDRPASPP